MRGNGRRRVARIGRMVGGAAVIALLVAALTSCRLQGATSVGPGLEGSCAVVAGGAVKCWGTASYGSLGDSTTVHSLTPVSVSGISGATKVVAGNQFSCALLGTGAVKC